MEEKIHIYFCYAREDELFLDALKKHLSPLKREGIFDVWYDRNIGPGKEWEKERNANLETSHLILLLVSPDFIDSEYCYSVELKNALKMHDAGIARVIPIIIRPVYWDEAPFKKLQVLPPDGKPISSSHWSNQDEAFFEVVKGIRQTIRELISDLQRLRNQPSERIREELLRGSSLSEALDSYPELATIFKMILNEMKDRIKHEFDVGYSLAEIKQNHPELSALLDDIVKSLDSHICGLFERGYSLTEIIQAYPEFDWIGKIARQSSESE